MKTSIFTIVLFFAVCDLFAQQIFNSVNQVWNYALANNPQNNIYRLKIEAAEKNSNAAFSYIYPKISGGFSFQKNIDIPETPVPGELVGKPGQTAYLQFGQKYNFNAAITISKTIFDWQSRFLYKISEVNVQLRKAEKEYFEQTLKEQIAQIYYSSLIANEAVRISNHDFSISDTMLAIAKARFNEGIIDSFVFNQAQINFNNSFEKLENSLQYKTESLNSLKKFLGLKLDEKIELTENASSNEKQIQTEMFLSKSKFAELNRLQFDISKIEVSKAKSQFYPKIEVIHYFGGSQYQDEFKINPAEWNPNQYTALSISVPIFTGFMSKSQYDVAIIERQIAEQSYKDELQKSELEDLNLTSAYLSSLKIAETSKNTFIISQENVKLAKQKYVQGIFGLDDYLRVFDDYLIAENKYLNNLSNYLIKKATIDARKE